MEADEILPSMQPEHYSADGYQVLPGGKFWDNNLRVVQIREVAAYSNHYGDTGEAQIWHRTTSGDCDTLTGTLRAIGRLARVFEGLDAEKFEPGTDLKSARAAGS